MPSPVLTKRDMYVRLMAGEFGNCLARYFSLDEWRKSDEYESGGDRLWGVQHTSIPGFPGTKLNVETADVEPRIRNAFGGIDYCITAMVPAWSVVWEGDVTVLPPGVSGGPGLIASGHMRPTPGSWREHMKHPDLWTGSAADALLRTVLNEYSYDDVKTLLQEYPDHVVEFSALDRTFGTLPGRNAVIWECRRY